MLMVDFRRMRSGETPTLPFSRSGGSQNRKVAVWAVFWTAGRPAAGENLSGPREPLSACFLHLFELILWSAAKLLPIAGFKRIHVWADGVYLSRDGSLDLTRVPPELPAPGRPATDDLDR